MPHQPQNPEAMTNTKAQMTNEVQNPNDKGEQVWPSGIWISVVIGILFAAWIPSFGFVKDWGLCPTSFMSLRAKRGNPCPS
jgi:hypothetical protein